MCKVKEMSKNLLKSNNSIKRKSTARVKNLSNQLGFSFETNSLQTASEIETDRWLKDNNVSLLSKNKDAFKATLSSRFVGKTLINEKSIQINEKNIDDNISSRLDMIPELEYFGSSKTNVQAA